MGFMADIPGHGKKYLMSNRSPLLGFIPYPSFEFLMGLGLFLTIVWCGTIPGAMPLS